MFFLAQNYNNNDYQTIIEALHFFINLLNMIIKNLHLSNFAIIYLFLFIRYFLIFRNVTIIKIVDYNVMKVFSV